ncbi:MFS transporter [Burkholderia sp. BCC1988]|uniref:MFS transporter n=1 Tax=Burkholderia sp. BCC1988 TaxID=2817443 RepID=UPI002AB26457|nr:MFS transporter [Burkholderia sp. BCC1988]
MGVLSHDLVVGRLSIAARLERLPITRFQRTIFAVIATAWLFDSMDLGIMTFVLGTIKAEFHLSTVQAGMLASASFVGMLAGAAIAGVLADRFGRKPVFQVSMIFWGIGSLLCAVAHDIGWLMAFRILLGFGMGMEFPIGQSIMSEIVPAAHRGRYVALLEGFWPIGFIAAGTLAYFLLPIVGWRGIFIVLAIPSVFVFVVRRCVPESPRWLESAGRTVEADEVVTRIETKVKTALGTDALPAVEPVTQATTNEPAPAGRASLAQLWKRGYARRTAMTWTLWFFALLGYYGLTTWLSALLQNAGYEATKSVIYTVAISLAGIPGFAVFAWLLEDWGRKFSCVLALTGSAIFAYLYGQAATTHTPVEQLIAVGMCMQFFLFGMWSVLYAYTPELYPTRVRATGAGFASAVGRLGSLLGPSVIGLVLPLAGQRGVFTIGAASFLIAALAVITLGVETRGRALEEVSV